MEPALYRSPSVHATLVRRARPNHSKSKDDHQHMTLTISTSVGPSILSINLAGKPITSIKSLQYRPRERIINRILLNRGMAAKDSSEQDVSVGQPSIQQDDTKVKKKDPSGTR